MKNGRCNKVLLFFCIIEGVLLLFFSVIYLFSIMPPKVLSHLNYGEEPGFIPEDGFVADARTAEAVGSAVIDHVTGHSSVQKGEVFFDCEHNVWIVCRSYWFSPGAEAYIDPKTGRILKLLFYKD